MEMDEAALAYAALGQATRLDLLRRLLLAGASGLAAGEIAAGMGVPPSTLSFHLRALEQAGLIAATRQGRSLVYAAQLLRLREEQRCNATRALLRRHHRVGSMES
jgi:arsenate reductase